MRDLTRLLRAVERDGHLKMGDRYRLARAEKSLEQIAIESRPEQDRTEEDRRMLADFSEEEAR